VLPLVEPKAKAAGAPSMGSRAARLSWRNSIRSTSGWGKQSAPGGFHALANPFAFPDGSGAAWRNPGGIRAIADLLSLVLARRQIEREQLLLHEQRAMPADDFRNRRLLLNKPLLSGVACRPAAAALASSSKGTPLAVTPLHWKLPASVPMASSTPAFRPVLPSRLPARTGCTRSSMTDTG